MCNTCTSTEHSTDNHPVEAPKKCVNCAGEHEARSKACDARTKRLGKQKIWEGNPSGGGKPTSRLKRYTKDNSELKDPDPPINPPEKSAESRRDRENRKDHEDLELRKSRHAMLDEVERMRQVNENEGEREHDDRMITDQSVYLDASARIGKKPEANYFPPKSKLVDANLRAPVNGTPPLSHAVN